MNIRIVSQKVDFLQKRCVAGIEPRHQGSQKHTITTAPRFLHADFNFSYIYCLVKTQLSLLLSLSRVSTIDQKVSIMLSINLSILESLLLSEHSRNQDKSLNIMFP